MKNYRNSHIRYLLTGAMILSIIAGGLVTGCKKKEEETYYTAKGVLIEGYLADRGHRADRRI